MTIDMKKYKKFLILPICGFLLFNSCEDFLDVDVKEMRTDQSFYKTPEDMNQALNGVYSLMSSVPFYTWYLSDIHSDDIWASGTDQLPYQTFNGQTTMEHKYLLNAWTQYFKVVANANKFLSKVGPVSYLSDEAKTQQIAEARFLRAMAYFDLVRYWGRVPLSTDLIDVETALAKKQSEPEEIYKVIEDDLRFAIGNLSDTPLAFDGSIAGAGHATIQAAKALLGKVLLTEAGFPLNKTEKLAEAKTLLTEVLDYSAANGDKWWAKTADEWGKMWLHENDNKYFIFEMQYTNTIEQGNPITIYSSPIYYDNSYSRKLGIYMNDRVAAMYRSVDTETGEQKFIDNRGQYILDPDYTDYIWKWTECDAKRKLSGMGSYKSNITANTMYPQNYPMIRLEDVMLMYAEISGSGDARAVELVNKIRNRAGRGDLQASDLDPESFLKAIKTERQLEFFGEGLRWHDLVRWGEFETTIKDMFQYYIDNTTDETEKASYDVYKNNVVHTSYLYPIPYNQMHVIEGLYDQNDGY